MDIQVATNTINAFLISDHFSGHVQRRRDRRVIQPPYQ